MAKNRKAIAGGALAAGMAALAVPSADGATFTVTNLDNDGAGSLRDAIVEANATAGPDVITFQSGLSGTIALEGQLQIYDSVAIDGPGAAAVTVDGQGLDAVFYVYTGGNPEPDIPEVAISGLTITGGASYGGAVVNVGGNLLLDEVVVTGNSGMLVGGVITTSSEPGRGGNLTVRNSRFTDNEGYLGAAIGVAYVYDADVTIEDSVITENHAGIGGAGVMTHGQSSRAIHLTIERTTIANNTSDEVAGGVLMTPRGFSSFVLRDSTVSGNSARLIAGGVAASYYVDVLIEGATISGNTLSEEGSVGGGVYFDLYYDAVISHSTIVDNRADIAGGIANSGVGVDLEHTIVANNQASDGPDVSTRDDGRFDARFSLIEDPSDANVNDQIDNIFGQDPQLGPLADNGGPTLTHLPAPTSPVINAGDPDFVPPPSTDQRGQPRVAGGSIDIGAVEAAAAPLPTLQFTVTSATVNEGAGTVTLTVTRTGDTSGTTTVSYASANGTAIAPGDYAATAGLLTWAPGDSAPKTIVVAITDDVVTEGPESFTVTLSAPNGATLGAATQVTVTITDNDLAAANIPLVDGSGKLVLIALTAMAGLFALWRKV